MRTIKIAALALLTALSATVNADQQPSQARISTGTVKGKVADPNVWVEAAKAYEETVKEIKSKEAGK